MSDTSIPDYGLFEATEVVASDLESNFNLNWNFVLHLRSMALN